MYVRVMRWKLYLLMCKSLAAEEGPTENVAQRSLRLLQDPDPGEHNRLDVRSYQELCGVSVKLALHHASVEVRSTDAGCKMLLPAL